MARSVKEEPKTPGPAPPKSPPKPPPAPKSSSDGKQERCRAFHGGTGCKRGAQCPYLHEWAAIPKGERSKLCMLCGAQGHRKDQCSSPATPKSPKKGEGGKAEGKAPSVPAGSSSQGAKASGFTAKQLEGLLQGATAALSTACASAPRPSPVRSEGVRLSSCVADTSSRGALLDSGATHSVVSKSDAKHLSSPVESCEVSLAGDVRKTWSKTPKGTLVAPATKTSPQGEPQMLVPLGSIVSKLNCRLVWSRTIRALA